MSERVAISIGMLLCVATANAADVRLRSAAVCGGRVVRVADVAEVFGDDQRLTQAVADLPLCPAPAAGRQRVLSQDNVRQLLEFSGVERKLVTVTGSETVTISGNSSHPSSRLARQPLVASGIRQAAFEVPSTPTQPAAKSTAARPAIAQPQPLQTDNTKAPAVLPLIEKGRGLTVLARSAGVQITTSGKAIDGGALGDMINVELADTKQRVMARITGSQTVELSANPVAEVTASIATKN